VTISSATQRSTAQWNSSLSEYVLFRSALVRAGYRVSLSHCEPMSLKTDGPPHILWDIMRTWHSLHPAALDKFSDSSPAKKILSVPPSVTIDFTPLSEKELKSRHLPCYFPNPQRDWGPGVRAGKKRSREAKSMQELIDQQRQRGESRKKKKQRTSENTSNLGVCSAFQKEQCQLGETNPCKQDSTDLSSPLPPRQQDSLAASSTNPEKSQQPVTFASRRSPEY